MRAALGWVDIGVIIIESAKYKMFSLHLHYKFFIIHYVSPLRPREILSDMKLVPIFFRPKRIGNRCCKQPELQIKKAKEITN